MDIEQGSQEKPTPTDHKHIVPNFQKNSYASKAFWSNTHRAKILIVVFWIIIIASMVGIALDFFELDLLKRIDQGTGFTMEEADDNDSRQLLAGILMLILRIISVVVFLNWFRRAYGNIKRLGVHTDRSESTTVWAWFVPIMNLYAPLNMMREIRAGLVDLLRNLSVKSSTISLSFIIGAWWAIHIINLFYTSILNRMLLSAETAAEMMTSTENYIFAKILTIIEALLVILMVYKISSLETRLERAHKKAGGSIFNP